MATDLLQYFQYDETAKSVQDKSFVNLTPLTPGSKSLHFVPRQH